jgi:hypothetical protein
VDIAAVARHSEPLAQRVRGQTVDGSELVAPQHLLHHLACQTVEGPHVGALLAAAEHPASSPCELDQGHAGQVGLDDSDLALEVVADAELAPLLAEVGQPHHLLLLEEGQYSFLVLACLLNVDRLHFREAEEHRLRGQAHCHPRAAKPAALDRVAEGGSAGLRVLQVVPEDQFAGTQLEAGPDEGEDVGAKVHFNERHLKLEVAVDHPRERVEPDDPKAETGADDAAGAVLVEGETQHL